MIVVKGCWLGVLWVNLDTLWNRRLEPTSWCTGGSISVQGTRPQDRERV
jgi:hypothetical protein